jgi:hypothetical protein
MNFYLPSINVNNGSILEMRKYFKYIVNRSIIDNRSNIVFTTGKFSIMFTLSNNIIYISEDKNGKKEVIDKFNNYLIVSNFNQVILFNQ